MEISGTPYVKIKITFFFFCNYFIIMLFTEFEPFKFQNV